MLGVVPAALDISSLRQLACTALVLLAGVLFLVKKAASRYFVVDTGFGGTEGCSANHRMPIGGGGGDAGGGVLWECAVCSRSANKRCSRCKSVRYCSQVCQSEHWEAGHKTKCRQARSLDNFVTCGTPSRRNSSSISLIPYHSTRKLLKEPKTFLFPYDEFVKLFDWDKPGFPPCGLINCGNSCFANVVLQCLTCTRPLVAYFLEKNHSRGCLRRGDDWCFLCELQIHIKRSSGSTKPFSPVNILSRLPNIGGNLGYGRQEDAHEFMRFAIDTMQSICLEEYGGEKAVDPGTQETTIVQYIFGGHLQSQEDVQVQDYLRVLRPVQCQSNLLYTLVGLIIKDLILLSLHGKEILMRSVERFPLADYLIFNLDTNYHIEYVECKPFYDINSKQDSKKNSPGPM